MHDRCEIMLGRTYWPGMKRGKRLSLFLHEVAHVIRGRVPPGMDPHDGIFADIYTMLVGRYLEGAPGSMPIRRLLYGKERP